MARHVYYRITASDNNREDHSKPLLINCSGMYDLAKPFHTQIETGRQDYYLQYVTTGQMQTQLEDRAVTFHEDMFILYRPHTPYHYWLPEGSTASYYWIHFTGFHAARLLDELGLETNRFCQIAPSQTQKARILGYFQLLFEEFVYRRPGFDSACAAIATSILVELARGTDKLQAGLMRKLESVAYLHSHFQENTPIAALAAMEHLSECRYREVFRSHTGFSPGNYRTILRLQHACDLLTSTDQTIAQIAAECGYEDVLYFLRLFKNRQGMTPGQYRARSHMTVPPKNASD